MFSCLVGERDIIAVSYTLYFSLIILKSLQLCGRRQIAEPRKYCLVRVIVFSLACVFSICFVSHRLGFRLNFLQSMRLNGRFGKGNKFPNKGIPKNIEV